MPGASLTVIILTRDEILHIERALRCLEGLARRVIVVDSGSSDGTVEAARALGAEVHQRRWINYAEQFQWALDSCAISTDWVMRLDADEVLGPALRGDLAALLPTLGPDISAVSLDRRHVFLGRWIRHGGRYPLRLVRIWRQGQGQIEQRWMDEHIVIEGGGAIRHVAGEFSDINLNDLVYFTAKHNGYATRESIDALIARYRLFPQDNAVSATTTRQAVRKRATKLGFYNRLTLGIGPLSYFLWRYIAQLGFLDGKPGLIYHGLQGLWYRFLVDARRFELERDLAGCTSNDERIDRLTRLTGHDLRAFAASPEHCR